MLTGLPGSSFSPSVNDLLVLSVTVYEQGGQLAMLRCSVPNPPRGPVPPGKAGITRLAAVLIESPHEAINSWSVVYWMSRLASNGVHESAPLPWNSVISRRLTSSQLLM